MNSVVSYAVLAYVAQTVSKAAASLVPLYSARAQKLLREWIATGTGIALALAGQMDIIGDVGVQLSIEPLGYIITGIIVGHGVQYTLAFLTDRPNESKKASPPEALPPHV